MPFWYQCDQCSFKTQNPDAYMNHIKNAHPAKPDKKPKKLCTSAAPWRWRSSSGSSSA